MREPTSLVGRRAELARLDGHLGAGGLVVVAGEAGVGKTRLVDELASRAAADPTRRVVRGRADEHEAVACGLWLGPIGQLDLPRPGSDASVPASEQRWEVVDLLVSGLRSAGPTLVVLDDLHWADDDSLWALEHVLDRLVDAPVTMVATTRPSAEARAVRWHGVYRRAEVIALDGLDVDEVAELAERLGGDDVAAESLWRRTGGNPLLVRELVLGGGTATARTSGDLLATAIERAGTDVADALAVVAVAGPDTPPEVLAAALGRDLDALDALLDAARRADLVRDEGGQVRVRHDLLADAAAARLDPAERRRTHAALAEAWAARADPTALAHRARHQLLAIPTVDATVAGDAALAAGAALVGAGRAPDAIALLRQAGAVLEPRAEVGAALKAAVALAEGDARWEVEDLEGAVNVSARAATHAAASGDPVLIAAAEVGAVRHHNPMIPDPVRVGRLAEVDDALPAAHDAVDPTLRIRLRGRRAVHLLSLPDRTAEAHALADDAVARARAHGDPATLARALGDRLFVLSTPEDYDLKAAAAEELIDVARASGRQDLARWGLEWRYVARLSAADLTGAVAALADLEALAAIMASPYWRWAAALRRCGLLAFLGDYDGALRLAGTTGELAAGVAPWDEGVGLEWGLRLTIGAVYGRSDNGADSFYTALLGSYGEVPLLFLQARYALAEALGDDPAAARRRLTPWLGRLDVGLRGPEGLPTIGVLAQAVVALGWTEPATELRSILAPFTGRLVAGNGVMLELPVDHHLAALALLDDDVPAATHHAQAAVAFARRLRAPAVEARALAVVARVADRSGDAAAAASAWDAAVAIAEPIGMRLGPAAAAAPAAAPAGRDVRLRFDNGRWFVESPYGAGHVADSAGMGQLVQLLVAPGVERAAVDLAGAARSGEVVVNSDLGPTLDARAKREYRQRIGELQADIEEAGSDNDIERAARHRIELDALLDQLRAAVGLGGRDRPQGSGSERARINVSRNIRRAIAAIGTAIPDLGAHLDVSVRTGHHCSYAPEPAAQLTWHVDR